jgi:hypothetical protein
VPFLMNDENANVQALALGFLDISVYDIKAAALNKLIEPEDGPWRDMGLDTIKTMCQKWPENWRVSGIYDFAGIQRSLEGKYHSMIWQAKHG